MHEGSAAPYGLSHINVISQNRQVRQFHDGVLSELLGVVRVGTSLQDHATLVDAEPQIADSACQAALHEKLKVLFVGNGFEKDRSGHDSHRVPMNRRNIYTVPPHSAEDPVRFTIDAGRALIR